MPKANIVLTVSYIANLASVTLISMRATKRLHALNFEDLLNFVYFLAELL